MPTPFGFTKLLQNMEFHRSSNVDSIQEEIQDEIQDFTPTEVPQTPASECSTLQVRICCFFAFFRVGFVRHKFDNTGSKIEQKFGWIHPNKLKHFGNV